MRFFFYEEENKKGKLKGYYIERQLYHDIVDMYHEIRLFFHLHLNNI